MRCARVQFLYEDYVSGTLPEKTIQLVEEHVSKCSICREYYESNDDVADLISHADIAHPGEPYVEDLSKRVLSSVLDPRTMTKDRDPLPVLGSVRPWRRPIWWAGAAAAAALLVFGMQPEPEVKLQQKLAELNGVEEPEESPASRLPASPLMDALHAPRPRRNSPGAGMQTVSGMQRQVSGPAVVTAVESPDGSAEISKSVTHPSSPLRPIDDQGESVDQRTAMFQIFSNGDQTQVVIQAAPTRRPPNVQAQISNSLMEQIIILDVMGTPESKKKIYEILQSLGASGNVSLSELLGTGNPILLKQWGIFSQAEELYRQNRPETAIKLYGSILQIDPQTALAQRANMRIADLYYQVWGDFERADEFYNRCGGAAAQYAFTPQETAHIERRRNLLGRYAASQWEPLRLMNTIARSGWPDAVAAVQQIASGSEAGLLMPEAAQLITARIEGGNRPSEKNAMDLVEALKKASEPMENSSSRAWISLALGEIYWIVLTSGDSALPAYDQVVAEDKNSPAGQLAQKRQYQIRTQTLDGSVR